MHVHCSAQWVGYEIRIVFNEFHGTNTKDRQKDTWSGLYVWCFCMLLWSTVCCCLGNSQDVCSCLESICPWTSPPFAPLVCPVHPRPVCGCTITHDQNHKHPKFSKNILHFECNIFLPSWHDGGLLISDYWCKRSTHVIDPLLLPIKLLMPEFQCKRLSFKLQQYSVHVIRCCSPHQT